MARALGINSQLLLKAESVYGTAPSGNYSKVPFIAMDIGPEQNLIPDDTLGHGRDMLDPSRDVININHTGKIPVDARDFGYWLKGAFGPATDAGTGPYTHVFTSGATSLPSWAMEVGTVDRAKYFMKKGVVVNTLDFSMDTSGLVSCDVGIIGQDETESGTSGGGTPTTHAYTRFNHFTGAITLGGSALAGITSAKFKYDNKLEVARVIRADGLIEGVDPLAAEFTGSITARFESDTLFDAAAAGDPVALTFGWTIDANTFLTFDVPRVFLPRTKTPISGPGGIQTTFNFQASKDASYMLQVTLGNDVTTY
jgi:hypothetical protein